MQLFLIRHGETVDNVAGLYAGSRDSALTEHGVLQARRLASHLVKEFNVKVVFSSNLQRAANTARCVVEAQNGKAPGSDEPVRLIQLPELREKDFGTGEGTSFRSVKKHERVPHEGSENGKEMAVRAEAFLDNHLFPALRSLWASDKDAACVVVAHGLILGSLFRALNARIPPRNLSLAPEVPSSASEGQNSVVVLPSWSNTGYLQAVLSGEVESSTDNQGGISRAADQDVQGSKIPEKLPYTVHIKVVNCVEHLRGLKKTRGGIGSARFDAKQNRIDSFFTMTAKKRKADDALS